MRGMIKYQDFAPQMLTPPGFLTFATYEPLQVAVDAANAWIKEHQVRVFNVETLLLPNIWNRFEEGPSDPALCTGADMTQWHQVVRVWYEEG
jgi:hypothetical protein